MLLSCQYFHNHKTSLKPYFAQIHNPQFLLLPVKPYRKSPIRISAEAKESGIELLSDGEPERFNFDGSFELSDLKRFDSPPPVEVMKMPEQWRRAKLAWLCKELHRSGTFTRVLNAQRKWIRQDDCTYIAVHCMRIREK